MVPLKSKVTLDLAVKVPKLIGLTPQKAKDILESLGLALKEDIGYQLSEQPAGKIIKQTPKAGNLVAPNSTVELVVAVRVPNIVDKSLDQAKKMLRDVGLTLTDKIGQEVSEKPETPRGGYYL